MLRHYRNHTVSIPATSYQGIKKGGYTFPGTEMYLLGADYVIKEVLTTGAFFIIQTKIRMTKSLL
jgi:hypothetical protein